MRTEERTDAQIEAKLGRPGAGLSWPAMIYMRYYLGPRVAAKADWQTETTRFHDTTHDILRIAEQMDNGQLQTRVLVPRLRGIEDSSRYWSAAMTLEHVMIVGMGIRDIIIRLSNEQMPPGRVETARVKPEGRLPAQMVLDNYKNFAIALIPQIETAVPADKRDAKTAYAHPWFGDFTLRQWHWLLAEHNAIHLRQLQEIAARISRQMIR